MKTKHILFFLPLLFWLFSAIFALAAPMTFTVNSTVDDDDGSCDPLPEDCTLREAILAANANVGKDMIDFDVGSGTPTIAVSAGGLPAITDDVSLLGNTGGATKVELDGTHAGVANGLILDGVSGSVIQGMVINDFSPGSGILIFNFSSGNFITGNFLGTDYTGTSSGPGNSNGILIIDSTGNTIGGLTAAERNVISGNYVGVKLYFGANANVVSGNYIGTDATGTNDLGNSGHGIEINNASGNVIGGNVPAAFNVVSRNGLDGIAIANGSNSNTVSGNYIGTNPAGASNLGNLKTGVRIYNGVGNSILGNFIAFNGGLEIDLDPVDMTPNDVLDADSGPNNLQNFPTIKSAKRVVGGIQIKGHLKSTPNANFTVQFFVSASCDPTGFGEGNTFIGQIGVTTGSGGGVNFAQTFPFRITAGHQITTTATSSTGDTSEFSACMTVT